MADTRLIERWLPIAEIGIESTRERTPMTPFPAPNRLHVWWARRPLVASRAAILASLLPADADREKFLHVIGIHGDPVAAKRRIAAANRTGDRLGADAYGYPRAFGYAPTGTEKDWLSKNATADDLSVLDPTAGGGSIPFEAVRLGLTAYANDLNPVATLIERATVGWPATYGPHLEEAIEELGRKLVAESRERLAGVFPEEPENDTRPDGYLWARTVTCPYCDGLVPLSPNWRLAPDGTGVRLLPDCAGGPGTPGRVCAFEIVGSAKEQFPGTVARGDGHCPYADCGRVIDGGEIKRQAQAGRMGEQLYAVVFKRRVETRTKSGRRGRDKWVRGYRAPRPEDDNAAEIDARLAGKRPEWEAFDIVPSERFPEDGNDDRPIQYGMPLWRDLFSPRQLLCHGVSVEVFREMLEADRAAGRLDDPRKAAYGYLALALDTMLDYNNRCSYWDAITGRGVRHIFARHDFAFVWSYAEMAPLVAGVGYDWAIDKTAKCIRELVALVRPEAGGGAGLPGLFDPPAAGADAREPSADEPSPRPGDSPFAADGADRREPGPRGTNPGTSPAFAADGADAREPSAARTRRTEPDGRAARAGSPDGAPPPVTITCKSGDDLDHLADGSVDVVVMDPPYYDNVMYAELSDFFYVWLKRTAGHVFPELFRRKLTDKEREAVANPARFAGQRGAKALAGRDYRRRMAAIFAECRRVLRPEGIMTLMFTHKATGAWDALTAGLIEAGFVITASWPINTESGGGLHIKNKAAAKSTVFLACRPRAAADPAGEAVYWEDVEPRVAQAVRRRVQEFQDVGITGVDLYLASFGPALEEFSRHWPVRRGTPRARPEARGGRRTAALFEEAWDPYAVTPEDALDAARREVKRWRLERLTHLNPNADLDPATAFFVLAWDAFRAPVFAYDEALRLARAVGIDPDREVTGRLAEKKGSDLVLWDSARRAAKGGLGPADGSRSMIDALHHAAHVARTKSLAAARDVVETGQADRDPRFFAALEAVLEVLPAGAVTGVALPGDTAAAGTDFEALYNLARLAWRKEIDEPDQLRFWRSDGAPESC